MNYQYPYGYMPNYYGQSNAMPDTLNQFKMPYQNNMQQMMPQQMQPQPLQPTQMPVAKPINDTMIFVLNENEASAFPVAPNNSVVLWDKDKKTFYIKTANAQGIPSMQIYDFAERAETSDNLPDKHVDKEYATKEEVNALEGKIKNILAMYDELKEKQTIKAPKTTKKEAE